MYVRRGRTDTHDYSMVGSYNYYHLFYMRWYSKTGITLGITAGATILSVGHVNPRYLGWSEGVTILPLIAWLEIPQIECFHNCVSKSCGDRRRRYYPTGRSRKPQGSGVIGRSYHPSADHVTRPHINILIVYAMYLWVSRNCGDHRRSYYPAGRSR